MIKKLIAALLCASAVTVCIMSGCGRNETDIIRETTTSFEEKASYYDALAQVDGTIAAATTSGNGNYTFNGHVDLLSQDVYERLVTIVERCYNRIYSAYGFYTVAPSIDISIDATYSRRDENYVVGNTIVVNAGWLASNKDDCDSLIYGLAEVALNFSSDVPNWFADSVKYYIRDEYGLFDETGTWSLPNSYAGGMYTEGGKIGAAFLKWIVQTYEVDVVRLAVREIHKNDELNNGFWQLQTGKTIGQLWSEYSSD